MPTDMSGSKIAKLLWVCAIALIHVDADVSENFPTNNSTLLALDDLSTMCMFEHNSLRSALETLAAQRCDLGVCDTTLQDQDKETWEVAIQSSRIDYEKSTSLPLLLKMT